MKKKILAMMLMFVYVSGAVLPVSAETTSFTITVPYDIYTKWVKKADNEPRFYVTGTSFSKSGYLYCYSHCAEDTSIISNLAIISKNNPSTNATYVGNIVAPGASHYMECAASVNGMNVLGRYTP